MKVQRDRPKLLSELAPSKAGRNKLQFLLALNLKIASAMSIGFWSSPSGFVLEGFLSLDGLMAWDFSSILDYWKGDFE